MLLSKELERSLERAHELAQGLRHEFIGLEHLLHALTYDAEAGDALVNAGVDLDTLRNKLESFLATEMPVVPVVDTENGVDEEFEPIYSLGVQFVLQVAAAHVQSAGKEKVTGANVLIAMFREQESYAVYFLHEQNVTRFDLARYVSHGISKLKEADDPTSPFGLPGDDDRQQAGGKDPLARFCVDLNARAAEGKIDPLIGRQTELDRTIRILARRRKNNPVFVGDAGVGKTAIVEGLAREIVQGNVPAMLKDVTIYALDMAALVAGTRFRGDFEERLKAVVDEVKDKPDKVLFIDEIHNIIGAGSASGGTLDASNLLKPALANGQIRCIGSTTFKEYRQVFEKDHALARRFQKIEVAEPSVDDTIKILVGLQPHYEAFHRVGYAPAAIRAAAELSAKHINDRFLPDKAIDIMDEAGAEVKLKFDGKAKDKAPKVAVRDVEAVVARIAKVPTNTVQKDDKERLSTLERDLKLLIYGQDRAVEDVVRAIQLGRAGLGEPTQPIGSFLFAGPTGVGKTELAKQLARQLGVEFIRFDMSEYQEKHTVSRLIGSPPGYVGFDQGGQLTEAVIRNPHAVLLLDEIEKAHPDIYQILLQVMDHATLTDNNGRKADFRQIVVIMTTNVGAFAMTANPVGFAQEAKPSQQSLKAVEQTFTPEFRNRLTAIVQFSPLDADIAERIVEKAVGELEQRLASKKVQLQLDATARVYLAKKGYDRNFGARPIRRLIETEIAHPLSSEILFGKLVKGGKVRIFAEDEGLKFDVH